MGINIRLFKQILPFILVSSFIYGWNPFSKDSWTDVGKAITSKESWENLGKDIEHTGKNLVSKESWEHFGKNVTTDVKNFGGPAVENLKALKYKENWGALGDARSWKK